MICNYTECSWEQLPFQGCERFELQGRRERQCIHTQSKITCAASGYILQWSYARNRKGRVSFFLCPAPLLVFFSVLFFMCFTQCFCFVTLLSVTHIDWLPTLMSLATHGLWNGSYAGATLDGVNMWDTIISNSVSPRKEILHYSDGVRTTSLQFGMIKLNLNDTAVSTVFILNSYLCKTTF
jgi:hypothetical protein